MRIPLIKKPEFFGLIILTIFFIPYISTAENSKYVWPRYRYRNFDSFLEEKSRHVCQTEHVYGGSRRQYSSECMSSVPTNICGRKTYIRYHCCSGYQFEHPISEGCFLVKPTVNLEATISNLFLIEGEKYFKNFLHHWGRKNLLNQTNSTLTIFVPQDRAFRNLSQPIKNLLSQNSNDNPLLLHMAELRLPTSQLHNNKNFSTMYGQDLHVHRYSNGIITVNCVRLVRANQLATNGIVHVVEDIIKPIKENENLMMSLEKLTNAKLFVSALKSTGVDKELRDPENHHTVILPTDEAILKLGKKWNRIKNDPELLKKFVQYHVIDCCICSSSVLGPYFPRTLEGEKVRMNCDVNDAISFNDVTAIDLDRVTTNGIIHTIDEALLPTSVMTVKEKLEDLGHHSIFLNASADIGLIDILDAKQPPNFVTVFAPFDDDFENANLTVESHRLNGKKELKSLTMNHVVEGDFSTSKLIGLSVVEAGLGRSRSQLAVNMHHNVFFINNARIVKPDLRVANGIIHVIDSILFPRTEKIIAKLKDSPDLSNFTALLKLSNEWDGRGGRRTVFAPTDSAFRSMRPAEMENLRINKTATSEFIRRHIVPSAVYPVTLGPSLINEFRSLDHGVVTVVNKAPTKSVESSKKARQKIEVNRHANVLRHHANAADGVLYVIDRRL